MINLFHGRSYAIGTEVAEKQKSGYHILKGSSGSVEIFPSDDCGFLCQSLEARALDDGLDLQLEWYKISDSMPCFDRECCYFSTRICLFGFDR